MPEAVVEQPASSTALLLDYAGVFRFLDSEWDVRLQRGLFSVRSAVIVYSYSFPISFLFSCGLHYSLWFEFIRSLFGRPSTTARHLCHQSRPWWTRPMKRQAETSQKYKKLIRIQNNYLRTWQMLKVCILEDTFSYVAHLIVATTWLFSGHWTDDKKWNVRDKPSELSVTIHRFPFQFLFRCWIFTLWVSKNSSVIFAIYLGHIWKVSYIPLVSLTLKVFSG